MTRGPRPRRAVAGFILLLLGMGTGFSGALGALGAGTARADSNPGDPSAVFPNDTSGSTTSTVPPPTTTSTTSPFTTTTTTPATTSTTPTSTVTTAKPAPPTTTTRPPPPPPTAPTSRPAPSPKPTAPAATTTTTAPKAPVAPPATKPPALPPPGPAPAPGAGSATGILGDGTNGKVAGTGISPPGLPLKGVLGDLGRMRRVGLNTASLDVFWYVDGITATTVHPGKITLSDAEIDDAVASARAVGMRVMLTPKLYCPDCARASWRGILQPSDRRAFFTAYRDMINHYAGIAQRDGVWLYFIGSEYNSLEGAPDEWREVARQVRLVYDGKIGYEVNWDVWNEVTFWDAVDVVGVSAYFPLSDADRPSVEELKAGWISSNDKKFAGETWYGDLASLAKSTGKPILFGEVGYPTWVRTAQEPFEPARKDRAADVGGQANAYEAVLETFEGQPWWLGAIWWEYRDSSAYSFKDRPAEQLLARWYVDGVRPASARSRPPAALPPLKAYVPRPPTLPGPVATHRFRLLSAGAATLSMFVFAGWLALVLGGLRAPGWLRVPGWLRAPTWLRSPPDRPAPPERIPALALTPSTLKTPRPPTRVYAATGPPSPPEAKASNGNGSAEGRHSRAAWRPRSPV